MGTTSLADAKNRLSQLVQSAQDTHERTIITKNGSPVAALMSIEDLAAIEETLAVLADSDLIADITAGLVEAARGDFVTQARVRADLAARLRAASDAGEQ